MPYKYHEKIQDAVELEASSVAAYKVYEGSLTGDTVLDGFTDLGRWVTGGIIKNDHATADFTVKYSVDGSTYGDEFTIKAGESLRFDDFIVYKKLTLVHSSDSTYRVVLY